jgi:hypothetical protein
VLTLSNYTSIRLRISTAEHTRKRHLEELAMKKDPPGPTTLDTALRKAKLNKGSLCITRQLTNTATSNAFVSYDEGKNLAKEIGAVAYHEVSALTGVVCASTIPG